MPRSLVIARTAIVAGILAAALAGCTQATPTTTPSTTCGGTIAKVLLGDDSAVTVTAFDPADVPKIFNVSASPAPTCYYKTVTTPAATNGISYTISHRTLLYIGLSDSDAAALTAAVRKTASVAPWSGEYNNPLPVAPATPPATQVPAPESLTASASWAYNFAGAATTDKGDMSFYEALPVTPGAASHAGLGKVENVVRIETELRQVTK